MKILGRHPDRSPGLTFALALWALTTSASAQTFAPVPFNLQAGNAADATQVMADFMSVVANGNQSIISLNSAIVGVTAPPATMFAYFNLVGCPTGWVPAGLYGLFLRAADNNRGLDPTGSAPATFEQQQFQDHTHQITGTYVVSASASEVQHSGGANNQFITSVGSTSSGTGNMSTGVSSSVETRPVNVSLLLCVKT